MISLLNVVRDSIPLTEDQQINLFNLLAARCRQKTKERLRGRINYIHLQTQVLNYPAIADRLKVSEKICRYVPGQSQPDELRLLRKVILG
jgi:hypothetical protein